MCLFSLFNREYHMDVSDKFAICKERPQFFTQCFEEAPFSSGRRLRRLLPNKLPRGRAREVLRRFLQKLGKTILLSEATQRVGELNPACFMYSPTSATRSAELEVVVTPSVVRIKRVRLRKTVSRLIMV